MAKGFTNVQGTKKSELVNINLLLDDIKALIGQTNHTSGTTTTGTVMAKLNKLLTDLTTTRAGYIDKLSNFGATGDTGGTSTAGTLTAKVNKLLTDWTTTRAGYLDTIKTYVTNLNTRLTDTRAGKIDTIDTNAARLTSTRAGYLDKLASFGETGDIGGTTTSGTLMAKVNALYKSIDTIYTNAARLTPTRAGYIDKLANFGAVGDTGGTATAGTAMAKLNAILQKVITEGVGIKSVQRGTFQEKNTSQDKESSITINLFTINPSKTFIIINGGLSAGYSGSSSAVRGYIGSVSATSFVYQTGRASMTISYGFISWQAVEFY